MDDTGVMLYNLIGQNSVGCWHESLPYAPENHAIVDRDDVGLVFPSDVKIDENRNVWVMSDRMPVFLIAELDYNDVNFRIYMAPLDMLIAGTVCDVDLQKGSRFGAVANGIPAVNSRLLTAQGRTYGNNFGGFGSTARFQNLEKPIGLSPGYTFTNFGGSVRPQTFSGYGNRAVSTYSLPAPAQAPAVVAKQAVPKAFVFSTHNNNVRLQTVGGGGGGGSGVGTLSYSPQQQGGPNLEGFTDHGSWWSRRNVFI